MPVFSTGVLGDIFGAVNHLVVCRLGWKYGRIKRIQNGRTRGPDRCKIFLPLSASCKLCTSSSFCPRNCANSATCASAASASPSKNDAYPAVASDLARCPPAENTRLKLAEPAGRPPRRRTGLPKQGCSRRHQTKHSRHNLHIVITATVFDVSATVLRPGRFVMPVHAASHSPSADRLDLSRAAPPSTSAFLVLWRGAVPTPGLYFAAATLIRHCLRRVPSDSHARQVFAMRQNRLHICRLHCIDIKREEHTAPSQGCSTGIKLCLSFCRRTSCCFGFCYRLRFFRR